MPAKEQTAKAADEITSKLNRLGFDEISREGPIEIEHDDSTVHQYFVYANKLNTVFYFQLLDEYEFGTIVYSYSVASTIAGQLSDEEVQELTGQDPEQELEKPLHREAGIQMIEQTPQESLIRPKFNLAAYATTALVNYREETTENGFPARFQCVRAVFPYDGNMSLRELDNRVETTLTAGDRGARYVESALIVDKGENKEPSEYVLRAQF